MNKQIAMMGKAGRKRYLESERRELLRKFGASGMTQAVFCRSNGLSDVTFSKWLRGSGVKSSYGGAAVLAEVEVISPTAREFAVEVVRPDRKLIRFKNLRADRDHAAFIRRVASC